MSEHDEPQLQLQLKDAAFDFLDLKLETEVKVEHLPVIYVAPAPVEVVAPVELVVPVEVVAEVEAPPAPEEPPSVPLWDDYVPDDVKQRLIYHWLRLGPAWASDIVMQAPAPPAVVVPLFNPLHFPRQRQIGFLDDGLCRAIRVRE